VTETQKVRVRFAPSPTGYMHLGNVRAALLNFLFARQKKGSFILRIEDTDAQRNMDIGAKGLMHDLAWLNLAYDEGPEVGGPYEPYFQSMRSSLYQEKLALLEKKGSIYRCFCTPEELEKDRIRQKALKMPPRYNRICFKLSAEEIKKKLDEKISFIWRLKTMQDRIISINDLAHGPIKFNLKEVSDLPLTRKDGSFTFIFANGVDDITMKISHIIRGEDHLTNTAGQVVLYEAFGATLPLFWHLPIICNNEGKKLSKRDFGFSLNDLRAAGFLPEAINNYLAIIGGSFEQEILSLDELSTVFNFEAIHSTSQIKYDIEKLKWINHKWIDRLPIETLKNYCMPFLTAAYPQIVDIPEKTIATLINGIKTDLVTLHDAPKALSFYFDEPTVTSTQLNDFVGAQKAGIIRNLFTEHSTHIQQPETFLEKLKSGAKMQGIETKELFGSLRLVLTGSTQGLGIKELFELLGTQRVEKRIKKSMQ
jgi:glutamyl-tRNA synthetase